MTRRARTASGLGLLVVALGLSCGPGTVHPLPPNLKSPYLGFASERYQDGARWLCRPDLPDSPCLHDRTATTLAPDGTRHAVRDATPTAPPVDCFYVYPTVDLGLRWGNHDDFEDRAAMDRVALAQATPFSSVCRVFAPFYQQITIGTYLRSPEAREPYLAAAFSDVAEAFVHYMGQYNQGRKVVLIGHSQGAEMTIRLLKRFFDDDPVMRERLLLALPIGGHLEVKPGQTTGGTFQHLPICRSQDETACIVAFRSYRGDVPAEPFERDLPSPGFETVCVNPADIEDNHRTLLRATTFPMWAEAPDVLHGIDNIQTPYVSVPERYAGQCLAQANGFRYLGITEVEAPNDRREPLFDLKDARLSGRMGMHVLDMQLPMGDLVELVRIRATR